MIVQRLADFLVVTEAGGSFIGHRLVVVGEPISFKARGERWYFVGENVSVSISTVSVTINGGGRKRGRRSISPVPIEHCVAACTAPIIPKDDWCL